MPSICPDQLKDIWAKSASKGEGGEPETLAQHTRYVMERLSDFIRLRPTLPHEIGVPRLWHILFWAAFLHDFGKAARGFQESLPPRTGERWTHRHEVLSLAFLDWIIADFTPAEQEWLVAAIVSHHKDASLILKRYEPPDKFDEFDDENQMVSLVAELEQQILSGLWLWLSEYPAVWCKELKLSGLGIEIIPPLAEDKAISLVQNKGADRIYHWLAMYETFIEKVKSGKDKTLIIGTLTLRGYIINADHSASAHAKELPTVQLDRATVLTQRKEPLIWEDLFEHQRRAGETEGSVLLTAPTGSGKTEAALLWAARQMMGQVQTPRLFYTLPYQASMNAMKDRLDQTFGKDPLSGENLVGIQHSRALLALYRLLLDKEDYNSKEAARQSKWAKNLAELNYPPVRIFSPYQMLKGMYRLKGYEALLSDYHQALFIFDEIHAYEVTRLAMILKTIEYLRTNYQARFMVMSATFPTLIKEWLQEALGVATPIEAGKGLFIQFQRHQLHLLDGDLLDEDNLARIADQARAGKLVLVVCNLVDRAQEAYRYLIDELTEADIEVVLLHGRFNGRDRLVREELVRDCAGRDEARRRPIVLVATQVVEVSLDIDLDTIYSDPAPLEALVQRFGRINRRRLQKNLAQVFVFRQPDDGQKIYEEILVKRTLSVLERANGCPLDESAVGDWLNEIYAGEVAEKWRDLYRQEAANFEAACVKPLRAFESNRDLERQFYKAFDGTEALPYCFKSEYKHLKHTEPIRANELLVPISHRRLMQLRQLNRLMNDPQEGEWLPIVDAPYDDKIGLDFSDLSKQKFGLGFA